MQTEKNIEFRRFAHNCVGRHQEGLRRKGLSVETKAGTNRGGGGRESTVTQPVNRRG